MISEWRTLIEAAVHLVATVMSLSLVIRSGLSDPVYAGPMALIIGLAANYAVRRLCEHMRDSK